ncbi:MAG: sulfatase-like hydrolase/transferase, partial [Acidimicrobiales bacterium]
TEPYTGLCPPPTCPAPDLADQAGAARVLFNDAKRFWLDRLRRAPVKFEVPWVITEPALAVDRFLPDLPTDADEPTMAFLHLLSPHQPWNRLGDGRAYEAPSWLFRDLTEDGTWRDEYAAGQSRVRHLQKLQYTDLLLGELLDQMEAGGAWDDTMLVVVADHGISFTAQQGPRYVSDDNEAQTMWSPLFIKEAGQASGESTDRPVQSIDIVPTIAEELGLEVPFETDGVAIVESSEPVDRSYVDVDGERVSLAEEGFDEMLGLTPGRFDASSLGLWKSGPLGELVGQPLTRFATTSVEPEEGSAAVSAPQQLDAVDVDADVLPLYVAGQVSEAGSDRFTVDDGDVVAVMVNGRIAGWSRLATISGSARVFGVTMPPELLVDGRNQLEVGVIPAGTTIDELRSGAVDLALVPLR